MRVYELAKQLEMESRVLIPKLAKLGIKVASHSSALSDEDTQKAVKALSGKDAPVAPARKKSRPAGSRKSATAASTATSSKGGGAQTARAKDKTDKPADDVARKPEKKHILIKRKKEGADDEASLADAGDAPFPGYDARESVAGDQVSPEMAAVSLAFVAEPTLADVFPSVAPSASPAAPASPVASPAGPAAADPAKPTDEKDKAKVDEKPKKSKKAGKSRDADLFAEIYEDAARWQDLRSLPTLRREERIRHIPSSTSTEITQPRKKVVKLASGLTVKEFAEHLGLRAVDVMRKLIEIGVARTLNQPMDLDAGMLIAEGAGILVEVQAEKDGEVLLEAELQPSTDARMVARSPVVTVMGHVDHGKTSLLDAIRQTSVTDGEAGGITQHIGAYTVQVGEKRVTFLDTPGHEAFTAMRARGAQATDIVILVVAADDGVMPQTIEAVHHAQAAKAPVLVAVNKIDKPGANPDKVKQGLAEHGLLPESWGGQTIYAEVSAKEKQGLDTLLEMILLQAEVMELAADVAQSARGVVLEARLDRGRGPVATVLVQSGVLRIGDVYVVGMHSGRVRALMSHDGKKLKEAGPSTPVEVVGLLGLPEAGDPLIVVKEERVAREIADSRQQKRRVAGLVDGPARLTLDDLFAQHQEVEKKSLSIVMKADTHGSLGALCESVGNITSEKVTLTILHRGVGGITESDVLLASASKALVMGFHVRPDPKVSALAEREGVEVRLHTVIYNALADLRSVAEGLLEPTLTERVLGRAEVRQVFSIPKIGVIAGCYVQDGQIARASDGMRLLRDNVVVHEGKLGSLRRFKNDVREVQQGYECGIGLENFNDLKIGDIVETYTFDKEPARL